MGQRTVKRVPLDFDHPHSEPWPGYLSPSPRPCPADCIHGGTVARDYVENIASLLLLVSEAATSPHGVHPWLRDVPLASGRKPGPDAAELGLGLAGRRARYFGHDAIDRREATSKIIEAAGLNPDWGICDTCGGLGYHPDDEAAQDAWEPIDPPVGEGWQLWETTSEGSPISPVFDTPERLALWCADNATLFAGQRANYGEWLSMIRDDSVDVGSTMTFVVPAS